MVKALVVVMNVDVPETTLDKQATVTVDTVNYTGTVKAIVNYTEVATGQVTLEGAGLKVKA